VERKVRVIYYNQIDLALHTTPPLSVSPPLPSLFFLLLNLALPVVRIQILSSITHYHTFLKYWHISKHHSTIVMYILLRWLPCPPSKARSLDAKIVGSASEGEGGESIATDHRDSFAFPSSVSRVQMVISRGDGYGVFE
jgi:hypothetical protein